MEKLGHYHLKYKICVSGAAETGHCAIDSIDKGKEVGREIVRQGAILTTGATTGFPLWAAMGAKEEGGISIGLSPAETEREHVEHYKLPLDYMDMIVYTGWGFSGRNLMLTRASDAVVVGCGRIGTLNEFTIAFEDGKPVGVLTDSGGTTDMIEDIIKASHREGKVIYGNDPKIVVERLIEIIKVEKITKI